jgi:hypothetical protein
VVMPHTPPMQDQFKKDKIRIVLIKKQTLLAPLMLPFCWLRDEARTLCKFGSEVEEKFRKTENGARGFHRSRSKPCNF